MKKKYRWYCTWDNGKGGFNPDYECCGHHGRFVEDIKTAITKGLEHNEVHGWCGWGYPDLEWKNDTTHIECQFPSGKIKWLKKCSEY